MHFLNIYLKTRIRVCQTKYDQRQCAPIAVHNSRGPKKSKAEPAFNILSMRIKWEMEIDMFAWMNAIDAYEKWGHDMKHEWITRGRDNGEKCKRKLYSKKALPFTQSDYTHISARTLITHVCLMHPSPEEWNRYHCTWFADQSHWQVSYHDNEIQRVTVVISADKHTKRDVDMISVRWNAMQNQQLYKYRTIYNKWDTTWISGCPKAKYSSWIRHV